MFLLLSGNHKPSETTESKATNPTAPVKNKLRQTQRQPLIFNIQLSDFLNGSQASLTQLAVEIKRHTWILGLVLKHLQQFGLCVLTHRVKERAVRLPASCRGPRLSQSTQPIGGNGPESPFTHLPYGRKSAGKGQIDRGRGGEVGT